jgi:hypothetical protein
VFFWKKLDKLNRNKKKKKTVDDLIEHICCTEARVTHVPHSNSASTAANNNTSWIEDPFGSRPSLETKFPLIHFLDDFILSTSIL